MQLPLRATMLRRAWWLANASANNNPPQTPLTAAGALLLRLRWLRRHGYCYGCCSHLLSGALLERVGRVNRDGERPKTDRVCVGNGQDYLSTLFADDARQALSQHEPGSGGGVHNTISLAYGAARMRFGLQHPTEYETSSGWLQ